MTKEWSDSRLRTVAGPSKLSIAGRHAIAHIEVADDVDRDEGGGVVLQTFVGQGADAARYVAGVEIEF